MSDVKKAAAEYSGCTLVGLNPLGQEMWQSKSLFLLGQREMKTEAFIAGAAWQREQIRPAIVRALKSGSWEQHLDELLQTFDDTKEKP